MCSFLFKKTLRCKIFTTHPCEVISSRVWGKKRCELRGCLMSVWAAPQEQKQAASLLSCILPPLSCRLRASRVLRVRIYHPQNIRLEKKLGNYISSSDIEMYLYLKRLLPSLPLRSRTRRGSCCTHLARAEARQLWERRVVISRYISFGGYKENTREKGTLAGVGDWFPWLHKGWDAGRGAGEDEAEEKQTKKN